MKDPLLPGRQRGQRHPLRCALMRLYLRPLIALVLMLSAFALLASSAGRLLPIDPPRLSFVDYTAYMPGQPPPISPGCVNERDYAPYNYHQFDEYSCQINGSTLYLSAQDGAIQSMMVVIRGVRIGDVLLLLGPPLKVANYSLARGYYWRNAYASAWGHSLWTEGTYVIFEPNPS